MGEYLSPPSIADSFREHDERIADIVIGPAPAWQTPVMENGWIAYGGGFAPPTYMRDGLGFVHLRGFIKSGTIGLSAFNLIAGFRPGLSEEFAVTSNHLFGEVQITAAGGVQPSVGSNVFVCLSGITFLAEH